jgi:hypothetical protein
MKVFNKGSSKIVHEEGELLPNTGDELSAPVAEKLLALYQEDLYVLEVAADPVANEVVLPEEPKKKKSAKEETVEVAADPVAE